jgi:SAM-dependent methyltransferase
MDELIAANQASWDARTPVHVASRFYDVDGWLRDRPGPRARETEVLGDVDGLDVVHLQCHIGLDTLQLARAGARVVGLDFSPAAIDTARRLARDTDLDGAAEFVCADVHDAIEALGGRSFDVVYVSLGALCWLPSVDAWATQACGLVAPGGRLYLHDGHPLAWALDDDGTTFVGSWFEEAEPYVDEPHSGYTDAPDDFATPVAYEWNHGVGEVVSAVIDRGLVLDRLEEHDWTVFPAFRWLVEQAPETTRPVVPGAPRVERRWTSPPGAPRLPLTFSLVAHRPATYPHAYGGGVIAPKTPRR